MNNILELRLFILATTILVVYRHLQLGCDVVFSDPNNGFSPSFPLLEGSETICDPLEWPDF